MVAAPRAGAALPVLQSLHLFHVDALNATWGGNIQERPVGLAGISYTTAPFTERNTTRAGVPLAPNGNFRIDNVVKPAPATCASPVLLIRNAANQNWFAAGIPVRPEVPEQQQPDSSLMLSPFMR